MLCNFPTNEREREVRFVDGKIEGKLIAFN